MLNCAVAIESQWAAEETPFLMLDAKFALLNTCYLYLLCAGISFLMMVHRHQMMLHHRQSRHALFYFYYCESVIVTRTVGTHTHILYSFLVVVYGLSPTYLKLKFVLETLHTCMQACPWYIAVLNGHGKEFFISMLLHICKIVKSWFIVFMERCTKWNVLFLKFKMVGSV